MNNNYIQLQQVSEILNKASWIQQIPKKWWIYTIRTSLWMTREVAARRAWVSSIAWFLAETREERWTITIQTLEKFLNAMSCTLAYMPKSTLPLEEIVKRQALEYSKKKMKNVVSTMSLENQKPQVSLSEIVMRNEADNIFKSGNWKQIWQ